MRKKQLISAIFFVLSGFFAQAVEGGPKTKKNRRLEVEIKAYIRHHLEDTHDFSIGSYTTDEGKKKYIGFSLPVILWDDELVGFSSASSSMANRYTELDLSITSFIMEKFIAPMQRNHHV